MLSLYVIDVETLSQVRQVHLPTLPSIPRDADTESRVSATPDGRWVIVSAFRRNSLVVLDAESLEIRRTLLVEAEPMNFDYHPDDPTGCYFTNHGTGYVSRLCLDTLEVTERIPSTPGGRPGRPEDLRFV